MFSNSDGPFSQPPEDADEKDEEQSVNKQLSDAVELQKLQASLNEQKRHALENYMQALSEDPISVRLYNYID